jgi:group I intron endonuclease
VIVYKAEGKNKEVYIGATCRTLKTRISEHKCHAIKQCKSGKFYDLIRKNGFDYFHFEILLECMSLEELDQMEKYFIKKYDSCANGLNGSLGGKENRKIFYLESTRQKHIHFASSEARRPVLEKMWKNFHTSENQKAKSQKSVKARISRLPFYNVVCRETGEILGTHQGYKSVASIYGYKFTTWISAVKRGRCLKYLFTAEV